MAKGKKKKSSMSKVSKSYRAGAITTQIISILLLMVPLIVYAVIGFVNGEPRQKIALGISLTVALILTTVNIVRKIHLKSVLWVLLLGIGYCVEKIQPLLIIMAVSTILDELVVTPLNAYYREKYSINREIDRRS